MPYWPYRKTPAQIVYLLIFLFLLNNKPNKGDNVYGFTPFTVGLQILAYKLMGKPTCKAQARGQTKKKKYCIKSIRLVSTQPDRRCKSPLVGTYDKITKLLHLTNWQILNLRFIGTEQRPNEWTNERAARHKTRWSNNQRFMTQLWAWNIGKH